MKTNAEKLTESANYLRELVAEASKCRWNSFPVAIDLEVLDIIAKQLEMLAEKASKEESTQ